MRTTPKRKFAKLISKKVISSVDKKRRYRSRCRCEKISNCPKIQISVARCPSEYFLCCFWLILLHIEERKFFTKYLYWFYFKALNSIYYIAPSSFGYNYYLLLLLKRIF